MAINSSLSDKEKSQAEPSNIKHLTPPEQLIRPEGLVDQAVNLRQSRQPRRERDPPDLQDVVTQQTEMMADLRARQRAAQPANPAEPLQDPAFDWIRLALPSETD